MKINQAKKFDRFLVRNNKFARDLGFVPGEHVMVTEAHDDGFFTVVGSCSFDPAMPNIMGFMGIKWLNKAFRSNGRP